MESKANITWQKAAILVAVLTVVLPVALKFSLATLFPSRDLLFQTTPAVYVDGLTTASIIVTNAGRSPERNVVVKLQRQSLSPEKILVTIGEPTRSSATHYDSAEPKISLSKLKGGDSFVIPVGDLHPDEAVVVYLAGKVEGLTASSLALYSARVESSTTVAMRADGIARPEHELTLHGIYWAFSPYVLAILLAALIFILAIALIHETFFDDDHKKMARWWRAMDSLQEKIDKDRRYQ